MFKFCVLRGISSLQVPFCHETVGDLVIVGLINKGLPESYFGHCLLLGIVVAEATQRQVIYVNFCTPTLLECFLAQVFRSE